MTDPIYAVRMTDITKSYPGVQALEGVNFDLRPGEVHCLVGENGAGKSTLMRILSGAERPDSGRVQIFNSSYPALDPATSHALGIVTIYQEPDLVLPLDIANNIFLGHEPVKRWGAIDWRRLYEQADTLLKQVGLEKSSKTLVRKLSAANRQLVQIAKALSRQSRIIIMDEPSASLSDYELSHLFTIIRQLQNQDMSVVYISHRLDEVLQIGNRVTVLRDGQHVITTEVSQLTSDDIIRYMVGRPLGEQFGKAPAYQEETALSVRSLTVEGHFEDVSFDLRMGEVLGLAGLIGAGRTALLNCLFGVLKPDRGEILLEGKPVVLNSPREAVRHGLGLVPEERRESGLVLDRSVEDNISLSVLDQISSFLTVNRAKSNAISQSFVDKLSIKTPSVKQAVRFLSGGNQQKVVLSKWLAANTRILLLDEPTRGIDVNAKAEIYHLINQLAAQGISIIMVSSELPEIIGMSDRILVMAEGRVTTELQAGETDQEEIMRHAVIETNEGSSGSLSISAGA